MSESASGSDSRKLSAILFSDIVGYSRLMEADEAATMLLLKEHNAIVSEAIRRHRGTLVKYIGDAALAVFDSAADAVRCALAMQAAVRERNGGLPEARRFLLRVGVAVGDVVTRDGDVFGNGVNLAARVQPQAEPGGVWITEMTHGLVAGQAGLRFESMGPRALKNIKLPVTLYRVLDAGTPVARRRIPPVAARALGLAAVLLALGWGLRRMRAGAAPETGMDDFYISVAAFNAPSAKTAEQAEAMRTIVLRRLEQTFENDRGVHVENAESLKSPRSLEEARAAGQNLDVDAVVWGDALAVGGAVEIQSYLTLERPSWRSHAVPPVRYTPGPGVDPVALMRANANEISEVAMLAAVEFFLEFDPRKALSILKRVAPPSETSRLQEARALALLGDWAGSEKAVRAQLAVTPKSSEPRRVLAILYMGSGRGEEAVAVLKTALALDPNDADTHRVLGIAFKRLGRYEQSRESFRRAAALKPGSRLPHLELGALAQTLGRWHESLEEYRIGFAGDPDDDYAKLVLSQALLRDSRAKEAAATLLSAADRPSSTWPVPIARVLLGRMTESELFALVEKEPDPYVRQDRLAESRYYLGMGRLFAGSKDGARELLRAVVDAPLKHILFEQDLAKAELARLEAPAPSKR